MQPTLIHAPRKLSQAFNILWDKESPSLVVLGEVYRPALPGPRILVGLGVTGVLTNICSR